MRYRSSLVAFAFAFLASACSHADTSNTTSEASAQPNVAVAQNDGADSPLPQASASPGADETVASPSADETAASPAASEAADSEDGSPDAKCDILPNAQVEEVTHLTVKSVKLTSSPDRCEFTFVQTPYSVTLEFATSGGKDDIDSTRAAEGGVSGMVGGLFKGVGADKNPGSDAVQSMVIATPPADVPKIGDDRFGFAIGPATTYIATKGDAYVEAAIVGFTPDGTTRWQATAELARRVLAAH
jgi:hypothetical protein